MQWAGLRGSLGPPSSATIPVTGEHRMRRRSALSGALVGGAKETGFAADGSGRDTPGEKA